MKGRISLKLREILDNSPDPTSEIEQRRVPISQAVTPAEPQELKEALSEFELWAGQVALDLDVSEVLTAESSPKLTAARAALVALFAEKERVLASAGGEIYDLQKSVASLSSQLERQREEIAELTKYAASDPVEVRAILAHNASLSAQLERLKAEQQDAQIVAGFIVGWWPGLEDALYWPKDADEPESNKVYAAAKRILGRQSDTGEG